MKLLVTGGSAFIGSTLAESLSDSFQVYAPSSSKRILPKDFETIAKLYNK